MSRLTWTNPNGEWGLTGITEEELKSVGSRIYAALCKLKDYEDTGLEPTQLYEIDEAYRKKCEELNKYEKAYKNGTLVWIPCKKGDVVYIALKNNGKVIKAIVKNVYVYTANEIYIKVKVLGSNAEYTFCIPLAWNTVIFPTYKQAEDKLKEMLKG